MEKNTKELALVDYDARSDSLALMCKNKKSHESQVIGDVVIDFDTHGNVVGIEFMNAQNVLSTLAGVRVNTAQLEHILQARLNAKMAGNTLIVSFALVCKDVTVEESIVVPQLLA